MPTAATGKNSVPGAKQSEATHYPAAHPPTAPRYLATQRRICVLSATSLSSIFTLLHPFLLPNSVDSPHICLHDRRIIVARNMFFNAFGTVGKFCFKTSIGICSLPPVIWLARNWSWVGSSRAIWRTAEAAEAGSEMAVKVSRKLFTL